MDFSKLLLEFVNNGTRISQSCFMGLSKLLHGFVKVVTQICQSCYLDLSKLFYVFLALYQPKPKLKFDQELKTCWSFCFEPKVLNESKYAIPWIPCAFGDILWTQSQQCIESGLFCGLSELNLMICYSGLHKLWYVLISWAGQGSRVHKCVC